jgi:hypothetical protein
MIKRIKNAWEDLKSLWQYSSEGQFGLLEQEAKPEAKECEHNWVMDGHNAGDTICSKCYVKE